MMPDSLKPLDKARLTEELALRVMGWRLAPDRFLKEGRSWLPKWRFAPFERLEDAFRLLDRATTYVLRTTVNDTFVAEVRMGGRTGRASGEPKATTVTLAVARAIGLIEPDESSPFIEARPRPRRGARRR